jgi:TonB family protein
MLKPDPTRYPRVYRTRISGPEWIEPDFVESKSETNQPLEFPPPLEELPVDLALDLRLHEILEQALLTTAATGALIALASGDQMVCRATAGKKSPRTGVFLNTRSGLSGVCIGTRETQRCDDTLTDSRVNAEACRDLDIRSIVVLPVLDGEKLWGILEVFSSAASAFGDEDVEALQTLCSDISRTVHEAVEGDTEGWVPEASLPTASSPHPADFTAPQVVSPEMMASEIVRASAQMATASRRRDYRTSALTAAVIALAVLLGWMVGRVGWSMAVNRIQPQTSAARDEVQTSVPVIPDIEAADVVRPAQPAAVPPAPSKPAPKPKAEPSEPAGGLTVYEKGKVVFRMPPAAKPPSNRTESSVVQPAMTKEEDSPAQPAQVSPQEGKSSLLERVEPEYPDDAKQQHIEGPVVLNALVGSDGSVRDLKLVSGNPALVKAASDAVRQWRFKPHMLKGQPVEFETRITVNFQLP